MIRGLFFSVVFFIVSLANANNCSQDEATVLMFGDFLLHARLQELALKKQDYSWFFAKLLPLLATDNFKTLNLEGPAAAGVNKFGRQQYSVNYYDNNVLGSYPMFNYHEKALVAIKQTGFDFVTTANNHALDRRALGVEKTIEGLDENQIPFVGTRKKQQDDSAFIKYVKIKNFKVGMISCTEHTNGLPDKEDQVLYCGKHLNKILNLIKNAREDRTIDGVMVFPHWGEENTHQPGAQQKAWARKFIEAGSFAVVGSHPHVIQTMESFQASNGNKGLIFYSLGNFISGQVKLAQKISLGLLLNISKENEGVLSVRKLAYIPLLMDLDEFQVIPLEPSEFQNKKSARSSEMLYGDQLLTQLLGDKNKLYFSKAIQLLNECRF